MVKQNSFVSHSTLIIWVFFIRTGCLWIMLQQEKVLESLLVSQPWMAVRLLNWLLRLIRDKSQEAFAYILIACFYKLFSLWQWRSNFLNGSPVIYISASTMLMQEIVISFEEVTLTKLKVKLHFSIFYAILKYCKRDLLLKQGSSSLTLDLSRAFVVFETYF